MAITDDWRHLKTIDSKWRQLKTMEKNCRQLKGNRRQPKTIEDNWGYGNYIAMALKTTKNAPP